MEEIRDPAHPAAGTGPRRPDGTRTGRTSTGAALVASLALLLPAPSASCQVQLAAQGQPYLGGDVTLHVWAGQSVGQVAVLELSVGPLDTRGAAMSQGFGTEVLGKTTTVLGTIPGSGRLDVGLTIPPVGSALEGVSRIARVTVAGDVSNPVSLPLDAPYLVAEEGRLIEPSNPSKGAQFGYRVVAGDFDADGVRDLAVSAAYETYAGVAKAGRVYVLWGPEFAQSLTLSSPAPRTYGFFGISLTVADVDGDDTDDLVVGETGGCCSDSPVATPALHVFLGGRTFPAPDSFVIPGPSGGAPGQYTGYTHTVAAGDFDDDGDIDLAVGNNKAPLGGLTEIGRIDVYEGPDFETMTIVPNPDPDADELDGFGSWLVAADVDGDGVDDIVEASPADTIGGIFAVGSVHVLLGPSLSLFATIECPVPLGAKTAFGHAIAVGDLDGDDVDDIVASDIMDRVFVLWGPDHVEYTVVPKPPAAVPNPFGETAYGDTLSIADMNADGVPDLLACDPYEGELNGCIASSEGTVFVALGPYWTTFHRVQDVVQECGDNFGWSIAVSNLDSDDEPEFIVSAPTAENGSVQTSGHATVLGIDPDS